MTTLRFHARYPVQGSLSEVDDRRPTDFSQTAPTLEEDRYIHTIAKPLCSERRYTTSSLSEQAKASIYGVLGSGGRHVPTTVRLGSSGDKSLGEAHPRGVVTAKGKAALQRYYEIPGRG